MATWRHKIEQADLKAFLDEKSSLYNRVDFIESDPIQVPHQFEDPRDIEIAAFLTATLSWGQKATIVSSARKLLSWMPGGVYSYLMYSDVEDFNRFNSFVHRTFNGIDCIYFLKALRNLYRTFARIRSG